MCTNQYSHQILADKFNEINCSRDQGKMYDFLHCIYVNREKVANQKGSQIYGTVVVEDSIPEAIRHCVCMHDPAIQARNTFNHLDNYWSTWLDLIKDKINELSIYSLINLYNAFDFHRGSANCKSIAQGNFLKQLKAAQDARSCRTATLPLIDPCKNLNDFIEIYTYLYSFINHSATNNKFDDFIGQLAECLLSSFTRKDLTLQEELSRLLRYWAAHADFFERFLKDKLGFEFHKPVEPTLIEMPAYYGSDNYVYLIGPEKVGKTNFLFYSENEGKRAKISTVESVEILDDNVEGSNRIENDRNLWKKRELEKTSSGRPTRYVRMNAQKLCRFICYDIAGEDLHSEPKEAKAFRAGASDWLKGHILKRYPCAIFLMFSLEEEIKSEKYKPVIELLQRITEKHKEFVGKEFPKLMPIYFIFNKADCLTGSENNSLLISSENWEFDNLKFLSLNYYPNFSSSSKILHKFIQDIKTPCRSLEFLSTLTSHVEKLEDLISDFIKIGFYNLSFVYTCSLYDQNDSLKYNGINALWKNVSRFVGESTLKARKEYYRNEFIKKINDDFEKIKSFMENFEKNKNSICNEIDTLAKELDNLQKEEKEKETRPKYFLEALRKLDLKTAKEEKEKIMTKIRDAIKDQITCVITEIGIPSNIKVGDLKRNPEDYFYHIKNIEENNNDDERFLCYGGTTTGCKYKDKNDNTDEDLLDNKEKSLIDIITNREDTIDKRLNLCKRLIGYEPKYPQFTFKITSDKQENVITERDYYKFETKKYLEKKYLEKELENRESLLVPTLENLINLQNTLKVTEDSFLTLYLSSKTAPYKLEPNFFKKEKKDVLENISMAIEHLNDARGYWGIGPLFHRKNSTVTIRQFNQLKIFEKNLTFSDDLKIYIKVLQSIQIILNDWFRDNTEPYSYKWTEIKKFKKENLGLPHGTHTSLKKLHLVERAKYLDKTKWLEKNIDIGFISNIIAWNPNKESVMTSADQFKKDFIKAIEVIINEKLK